MAFKYTSEEMIELRHLACGATADDDTIPQRVLINTGLAERFDPGMMRITDAGRAALLPQQSLTQEGDA